MSPDVEHTPAGGSPPRPVPQLEDWIKVVKLPDEHDPRLKLGQRGLVVVKKEAMYCVRFGWGLHWLTVMQIEMVR